MIRAEQLSFGFPDKELYHNISFTLDEGCHCALIGSNGTGKSTLADLIRRPEQYLFDGKLMRENVGRIGFVEQFAARSKDQTLTVQDYLSGDFLDLQTSIDQVCTRMATAEDLDELLEQYQSLLDESESMDADNYEQNIRRQLELAELGDKAALELAKLSGGEYKLVQVIRQMLRRPGLLIMDEPDVFLDFENLTGLRQLINAYQGTMLVITHNRFLLSHCFYRIWHLENADLQEFDGCFLEYNYFRLHTKVEMKKANAYMEAEIQRATQLVERLRKEATEVVDPLKGRTLKGKVSYLERVKRWQVKAPFVEIRQPDIHLPHITAEETAAPLLAVSGYSLAFEKELLENVTFTLNPGEKIAIVGPNGTGKSTMLKQLAHNSHPAFRFSPDAIPAFFSQLHQETLNEDNSIYQEFYDLGFDTPAQVEKHLKHYCFDPDSLHRTIRTLSGGEKNLLQLAKLAVGNANLLLLDEPSSHLDTFAQIALEQAIQEYRGAVLMVSHDFYSIVNCADRVLYVENGTIRPMSARAFRKMIYKNHFPLEYLELEQQKKELETKISRCLESGDCDTAQQLCDQLGDIVRKM